MAPGAVIRAQTPRQLTRAPEAGALWHTVYGPLSEGQPGLYGAATNRAEAQVLRLSVLYALVDRSPTIRAEHLLAALAIWEHAASSARWIFGDATGDPIADTIWRALRTGVALTRLDIVNLLGRNIASARIDRALERLRAAGWVERRMDWPEEPARGRPTEVWSARRD